ncbi:MAG: DUF465 domain-containing protein [Deltaproteobacteria bacterium]|nr:DUF465 domain-containing protein [Deltaproteobacteria bacterium]
MEKRDEDLVTRLLAEPGNDELRNLMGEHRAYETQLEEFNKRVYLSDPEQVERKRLQKLKLAGRDRIEQILAEHREKENSF